MITWIVEPWSFPFMRWALLCCLVLAGIHAYLGFHVVRRGILFVDLAMAQMAALGAACAIVLGMEHETLGEYAVSLSFALAAAAFFAVVRSRRISHEAIIAIFYAMATAATFVVLERSPHGMEEVKHLFVGQVLTVAPQKVLMTAVLYGVIGLLHARMHPTTLAISEGREVPRRGPVRLSLLCVVRSRGDQQRRPGRSAARVRVPGAAGGRGDAARGGRRGSPCVGLGVRRGGKPRRASRRISPGSAGGAGRGAGAGGVPGGGECGRTLDRRIDLICGIQLVTILSTFP